MQSLRSQIGQTAPVQFGYRLFALWQYRDAARAKPRESLRFLVRSNEIGNFTYNLDNLDELAAFVADVFGARRGQVDGYFDELLGDRELIEGLRDRLCAHRNRDDVPRLGARPGWYAAVRLLKPRVVAETGVHDGLGSSILLRALERNAAEGAPGRLLAFDIDPSSGWLVDDRLKGPLDRRMGDTKRTLPEALAEHTPDILIHDSLHEYDHERFEYETALAHRGDALVLMSDDAQATTALRDVASENETEYRYFQEQPRGHFWPGGQLGVAVFRR